MPRHQISCSAGTYAVRKITVRTSSSMIPRQTHKKPIKRACWAVLGFESISELAIHKNPPRHLVIIPFQAPVLPLRHRTPFDFLLCRDPASGIIILNLNTFISWLRGVQYQPVVFYTVRAVKWLRYAKPFCFVIGFGCL